MEPALLDVMAGLAGDPAHGWSIGSFGAIGEFMRDADEPATVRRAPGVVELVTARGALRIAPTVDLVPVAWDSLSSDGESWGHALAFCCSRTVTEHRVIRALGPDHDAIRPEDRAGLLFDLGVGCGAVSMAVRTSDPAMVSALGRAAGRPYLSDPALMVETLRAQPDRVLISPAGRLEVFQPIPPPDGASPAGPHTHLLSRLVAKDRPHSANTPVPEGLQSALTLHPRSPWRAMSGERHPFRADADAAFEPMLRRFGLPGDAEVEERLRHAIETGTVPGFARWPDTRRGRAKARIVLRRMAAAGDRRVKAWRAMFDQAPMDVEEGEEA